MNLEQVVAQCREALDGDPELLVAHDTPDGFAFESVAMAAEFQDRIGVLVLDWLEKVEVRTVVPYSASSELEKNELFLIEDPLILEELRSLDSPMSASGVLPAFDLESSSQRIALYSFGSRDPLLSFIKRSDPRYGVRGGRRFLGVFGNRMQTLKDPLFAFHSDFDFVLASQWALVASQTQFERLFRESAQIEGYVSEWVGSISRALPMNQASSENLMTVALTDSRLWRRLREIHRRGHLPSVSINQVESYAKSVGVDVSTVIVDGELVFDASNRFSFVHLLNEDLFLGGLTGQQFEAQRKTVP